VVLKLGAGQPGTTQVLEVQMRKFLPCTDKERCSPLIGGATNSKMLDLNLVSLKKSMVVQVCALIVKGGQTDQQPEPPLSGENRMKAT